MNRIAAIFFQLTIVFAGYDAACDAAETHAMHIVRIECKPTVTADQIEEARVKILAFKGAIPGILDITFGHAQKPHDPATSAHFQVVLCVIFENRAALAAYSPHPLHEAVANTIVVPMIQSISIVDYDVIAPQ